MITDLTPNLMPNQKLPFNGDTFIEKEFLDIKNKYNINIAIETGSCVGGTTRFLSNSFDKIFTIEVNETYRQIMLEFCKGKTNITSIKGDSKIELEKPLSTLTKNDNVLFFLDAHWGGNCPLEQELDLIAKYRNNFNNCVIAIHDFLVPNEKLNYDTYNNQALSFEWLKNKFNKIYNNNFDYYYNTFEKSGDVKVGIIYLMNK